MSWEEIDIGEKRKTDCAEFVTRDIENITCTETAI